MDAEKGGRPVRTVFQTEDRQYVIIVVCHSRVLTEKNSWRQLFARSLFRPFALFVQEPIIQLFGLYMAFVYGITYRKLFVSRWSSYEPKLIASCLSGSDYDS